MKKIKEIIIKNYPIILMICLAFALRMLFFKQNFFFGFEQGRDFLKVREILTGNLTLVGPKTDIDGIFHGAFSYYVLVAPYVLFRGNPYLVQVFFILINSFSVIFLYKFVEELFNKKVALISSFLYAISYSAIIYARWLSNPTMVPTLAIMLFYFLSRLRKSGYFLILISLLWSLIFHLEVVVSIILIPGIIFYIYSQKVKLDLKTLLLSAFTGLAMLSPYIIFNLKHENILINGVINFIASSKTASGMGLNLFGEFVNEIVDGFFPESRIIAFAFFWFLLVTLFLTKEYRKNNQLYIILVCLFSGPLFYFLAGINALRHFYVLVPIFLSILVALSINFLIQKRFFYLGVIIIFIILFGNVLTYKNRLPKSIGNFLYHAQHMYLYDEIKLIDFIYNDAKGREFSYDYYSIPYWKNEAWEYLFSWYGKRQYGYLPAHDRTSIFYVLIEPDESQPSYQKNWYDKMNQESKLLNIYTSGYLRVEKRLLTD